MADVGDRLGANLLLQTANLREQLRSVLGKLAQQRGDGRLLLAPSLQGVDALEENP
jgi:hypothetical protein